MPIHDIASAQGYDTGNLRQGEIRRIAFLLHRQHNTQAASPFYLPVTRHLIALGRRRIAMLTGPLSHHSILERYRGFRKALFGARMHAHPDLEIQLPSIGDTQDNLHRAVDAMLAREPRPDALFCYNDSAALAAMGHCLARGLKVPHDIAIVGFDDISAAAAAIPPLSSVNIDKDLLGRMGVDLLLDKRTGSDLEQTLTLRLMARESSTGEAR